MTRRRRHLLLALGIGVVLPRLALGQSKQLVLIGWLNTESRSDTEYAPAAFKQGMAELGWKEGASYVLEESWAEGHLDRLPRLAQTLQARKPAIVVTALSRAAQAAAKALPDTPIVQANGGTPIAIGLAKSLARPGGMVTGITNIASEIAEKYLELLLAAVPRVKRIGFLVDSTSSNRAAHLERNRRSAARYSVDSQFAEVARPEDLEPAIARLAKVGVQALVLLPSSWWGGERVRIMKLALAQRWPVATGNHEFSDAGALLTYGADRRALYHRAAWYVDKILKGAKPGDLPIEQPTKFELVVNLKTAKALGLTLPQPFLMRADRVIE